ncbi:MAG: hypothetical protein IVW52_04930 [Acidimicrobiales bacterium]|nr:hypothetical protein [Acidimicrobiales bacterium]
MLPPGTTVYTVLRHISRSGMDRVISCHVILKDDCNNASVGWVPSGRIARVLGSGWRDDPKRNGNHVGGVGMDMGWHLVYTLSFALYGKEKYGQEADDAGRVLTQRWL